MHFFRRSSGLPGNWHPSDRAFYRGDSHSVPDPDGGSALLHLYGDAVEVVGPSTSAAEHLSAGEALTVRFSKNGERTTVVRAENLSRRRPPALAGGWQPLDVGYYVGKFENFAKLPSYRHVYGLELEVLGPSSSTEEHLPPDRAIKVRFAGAEIKSNLRCVDVARQRPPPLAGNWKPLELGFFSGTYESFSNVAGFRDRSHRHVYGQQVQVIGPSVSKLDHLDPERALEVLFPGNALRSNVVASEVGRLPPKGLAGSWRPLDIAYYTGKYESFPQVPGHRHVYGRQVQVLGPSSSRAEHLAAHRAVAVQFPGNLIRSNIEIADLSQEAPPPLPGDWAPMDEAYYVGGFEAFPNIPGHRHVYGHRVLVIGPSSSKAEHLSTTRAVEVQFPGNEIRSNIELANLARKQPPPLPDGWRPLDDAYLTRPEGGGALVAGARVMVLGPTAAAASAGEELNGEPVPSERRGPSVEEELGAKTFVNTAAPPRLRVKLWGKELEADVPASSLAREAKAGTAQPSHSPGSRDPGTESI